MISRRATLALPALAFLPACARAADGRTLAARLDRDLFFVPASAGSGSGLFLIDTGAPVTVLDLAFARRIGAPAEDRQLMKGAGGARAAWRAPPMTVTPQGGPSVRLTPSMTDLSRVAQGMGAPLAGVIGCDLLSGFSVTFDYRDGAVSLASSVRPPPGASRMRFSRTPYVACLATAGGRSVAAEFQIDTGSNTAIEFWRPFADKAFPDVEVSAGGVLGVAGSEQSRRGRVDRLALDGLTITDLEANFANETRPDDAGPAHGGIIGGPAWRGLSVTLDFPDRLLWAT
jgi:hypothetical protein